MARRKVKHSKSPWRLDLTDDRSYINSASGDLIAEVETWMDEEKEANANLIAAAPDLLAACKAAWSHLNLSTTSAKALKKQIIAAIQKAEGK